MYCRCAANPLWEKSCNFLLQYQSHTGLPPLQGSYRCSRFTHIHHCSPCPSAGRPHRLGDLWAMTDPPALPYILRSSTGYYNCRRTVLSFSCPPLIEGICDHFVLLICKQSIEYSEIFSGCRSTLGSLLDDRSRLDACAHRNTTIRTASLPTTNMYGPTFTVLLETVNRKREPEFSNPTMSLAEVNVNAMPVAPVKEV